LKGDREKNLQRALTYFSLGFHWC